MPGAVALFAQLANTCYLCQSTAVCGSHFLNPNILYAWCARIYGHKLNIGYKVAFATGFSELFFPKNASNEVDIQILTHFTI